MFVWNCHYLFSQHASSVSTVARFFTCVKISTYWYQSRRKSWSHECYHGSGVKYKYLHHNCSACWNTCACMCPKLTVLHIQIEAQKWVMITVFSVALCAVKYPHVVLRNSENKASEKNSFFHIPLSWHIPHIPLFCQFSCSHDYYVLTSQKKVLVRTIFQTCLSTLAWLDIS